MGATIHFKIKYHGLKFSDDSIDYFKNISYDDYRFIKGDEFKNTLPPYTEFTSKDFPNLQKFIDGGDGQWLSFIRVNYYRDLGSNQKSWKSYPIKGQMSNKSFEDAEKNNIFVLDRGEHISNAGEPVESIYMGIGNNDIDLQKNTDAYIILIIDSDPQSDSWYYPSILYNDDVFTKTEYIIDTSTHIFNNAKPDLCVKWCTVGFKGIFYPKTNKLNTKVGMVNNEKDKNVYINTYDVKQGKYISSTKYTTPFVLPSDVTDYPDIHHVVSFRNLANKKTQLIIDFLHDKETTVSINSKADLAINDTPLAINPINYDFTKSKGVLVDLETDLKPDSTKYITVNDTFYTIYYFKDGKPEDLDINNYSLDYLIHHADTRYITKPEDNRVGIASNIQAESPFHDHTNEKLSEAVITPARFPDYGYYLILPLKLKDYYGVLVDNKGTVLQKVYPNKVNKIEEKYRPKYKDVVIGYYNEPYDEVGGEIINSYYYTHGKDYGITSQGYIDPNRYDNFICLPFDVLMTGSPDMGNLPAFKLKYRTLSNLKTDLGGYYNLNTGKVDPITIKDHTIGSTTSGSSGSTGTGGSSGSTGTGGSSSSTTGGTTGGSSETNVPNTPINLNDQIHLYSINQQNIIDLSTKDLGYQTSLKRFATYDANNFINQVYILPFSLPTNLKEIDDHIVTGLYKLDTDTVIIKQDHYDLNLGSITVKPKYNNGFDYNVTKCTLHLPFTNLINLDINDILNKTINIKYKVSLLNADTTINILSDDNLIFTGKINIGTDLQLFSINSNNIAGLLNSVLQNEVLTPYITITRNKPINNLVSYETSEHNQLNNYTGFVQTNNSSVSCGTQEEQQEIERLLNGGIYIK